MDDPLLLPPLRCICHPCAHPCSCAQRLRRNVGKVSANHQWNCDVLGVFPSLVGGKTTPLKNMSSSVGWWHSQYMDKYTSHVPVTTNQQQIWRYDMYCDDEIDSIYFYQWNWCKSGDVHGDFFGDGKIEGCHLQYRWDVPSNIWNTALHHNCGIR